MGLLGIFGGKSPEEIETIADEYLAAGEYGAAKVEYEKALQKAEKKANEKQVLIRRLSGKLQEAKEYLAGVHIREAAELIATGDYQAGEDLLHLASELTESEQAEQQIREQIRNIRQQSRQNEQPAGGTSEEAPAESGPEPAFDAEQYFHVLVSALPEEVQSAYEAYGEEFREGYIALNQGDFSTAAEQFEAAIAKNPSAGTWIPLELATAYMHKGQPDQAREVMEAYMQENPESLRGCQLLCDICWETGDYEAAARMLYNRPDGLLQSTTVQMLLGETYYQAGSYEAARDVFVECTRRSEDSELAVRALAKTYEALGETEAALDLYGRVINGCSSCGARPDPFIKRRFAELSFQSGDTSKQLLEMFLSLLLEDPDNRQEYYDRIGRIYEATGYSSEARRYFRFAEETA